MKAEQRSRMMQCNKCKTIFDIGSATITYRKFSGVNIREKVCPECGGAFHAIELPGDLDKYLYPDKDERYYQYR